MCEDTNGRFVEVKLERPALGVRQLLEKPDGWLWVDSSRSGEASDRLHPSERVTQGDTSTAPLTCPLSGVPALQEESMLKVT